MLLHTCVHCALHGLAVRATQRKVVLSWFAKEANVANRNNDQPIKRHDHKDELQRYKCYETGNDTVMQL